MSLYILMEKSSSYFFETRRKQEIASIKSLNQKRIPTIVFENIDDIPEIFTDSKAVLLVAHGLNKNNEPSPRQFIIDMRIQKAKSLLANGTHTITSISEECGFSSVYHFCRAFKDKSGMTPTEYAKLNKIYQI